MAEPELEKTISREARRDERRAPELGRLTVVHPRGIDWQLEISKGQVTIGRMPHPGADAIEHDTVSRRHVELGFDAKTRRHKLTDLGSHNGTKVENVVLPAEASLSLEDNTMVEIGDVLLVYERGPGLQSSGGTADLKQRIPGRARAMNVVRDLMMRAAPDPSPILIAGETGTGKEWVAREIHRLSGRSGKLLAINCAALTPQLIESQLFGHVKGAFTGANSDHDGFFVEANGGTLFLDELGELPLELQPKLLRVLQEGEVRAVGGQTTRSVDVRIVAATNRDLATEVQDGTFRRDLYARLALWELALPPLRDRKVDILLWFDKLHAEWAKARNLESQPIEFNADAAATLLVSSWHDNLRGVDRLVHALSSTAGQGDPIGVDRLPAWVLETPSTPPSSPPTVRKKKAATPSREEFEAALERHAGNVSALAKEFGRDRRQIYRWLETYGLSDRKQGRKPE